MLSFSKIVTFAAVAFGTLSQAVPLSPRAVSIEARAEAPVQLKDVLTGLTAQLTVAVEPINYLTHDNATVSVLHPILEDVEAILKDAVYVVEGLVSQPVHIVLEGVDGVLLTVEDVFDLVYDVLVVVFKVLKIVGELVTDISGLLDILPIILATIADLLARVIEITAVVFGNALIVRLKAFIAGDLIVGVLSTLHLTFISL